MDDPSDALMDKYSTSQPKQSADPSDAIFEKYQKSPIAPQSPQPHIEASTQPKIDPSDALMAKYAPKSNPAQPQIDPTDALMAKYAPKSNPAPILTPEQRKAQHPFNQQPIAETFGRAAVGSLEKGAVGVGGVAQMAGEHPHIANAIGTLGNGAINLATGALQIPSVAKSVTSAGQTISDFWRNKDQQITATIPESAKAPLLGSPGKLAKLTDPQWWADSLGNMVGGLAPLATGPAVPVAFASQVMGENYDEMRRSGRSPNESGIRSIVIGAITGLLMELPISKMFGEVENLPAMKRAISGALTNVLIMPGTSFGTTLAQELGKEGITAPKAFMDAANAAWKSLPSALPWIGLGAASGLRKAPEGQEPQPIPSEIANLIVEREKMFQAKQSQGQQPLPSGTAQTPSGVANAPGETISGTPSLEKPAVPNAGATSSPKIVDTAIRDESGKVTTAKDMGKPEFTKHDDLKTAPETGAPAVTKAEGKPEINVPLEQAKGRLRAITEAFNKPRSTKAQKTEMINDAEKARRDILQSGGTAEDIHNASYGITQPLSGAPQEKAGQVPPESQRGFVDDKGQFHDRQEAAKMMPEVPLSKPEEGLHSEDLRAAKPEGKLPVGPGAQNANEPKSPELKQLSDIMAQAKKGIGKPEPAKVFDLRQKTSEAKDAISKTIDGLHAASVYLKTKLEGLPTWNGLKAAIGERQTGMYESTANAKKFVDEAIKMMPDQKTRDAISNWIDTGGDEALLRKGLAESPSKYKPSYERALRLTPEETTIARNVQSYFEKRLQQAQEAGILEDGIENYIHRFYERKSAWKDGILSELRSGVFTGKPALANQRIFKYDFEAEKAGYAPVKDFVKRVAGYDLALNKSLADRQLVKTMMEEKMADGKPAIEIAGIGNAIEGDKGTTLFVTPSRKAMDRGVTADGRTYIAYDHPALRKYKWIDTDENGKQTMLQGSALVHPDALKQIHAVFGRSAIRDSRIGRAALGVSSTVKGTMFDASIFHLVQLSVHAAEHRTFSVIKEINFEDPTQRALMTHGLVGGATQAHELFSEGVSGSSLTRHLPYFGPKLQVLNEKLFGSWIPRLKMSMGLHALERNRTKFAADLKSGKMSEDQLLHLTAMEANEAFGEQNYEMMGRNKTFQDVLRLVACAPDFLESRAKFVGRAATKYGAEQRAALFLGAGVMYVTARILNKMINNDYHFELKNMFNVVHNGKAYSLRTVQGDILHLINDPEGFIRNRLNPVFGRPVLEALTGRNWYGKKVTGTEQLKDVAKTPIPISLRGWVLPSEESIIDSIIKSVGLTEIPEPKQKSGLSLPKLKHYKSGNNQ
jgi:hypothetical protein